MELTKERLTLLIAGGSALGVLMLYLLLYQPLLHQLKVQGSACQKIESEVGEARNLIARSKVEGGEKILIREEEISMAIDELTRVGKLKGVNFISLTPKASETSPDSRFKVLPLEIETESSYEALGLFLGALDDLRTSLMTIASFKVGPHNQNPSRLRTKLILHMCLAP